MLNPQIFEYDGEFIACLKILMINGIESFSKEGELINLCSFFHLN